MPPRSLWKGTVAFGLVTVPVRLYPAVREQTLRFRLLHEPDSSPIGYEKVCKAEGRAVPDDEVVKAYEVKKGEFVVVDDADFEAARTEGDHSIQISDFVPLEEIDPVYFAHTYYVGPDEGAERAYALLEQAMEESGLAAVATFVMREREHLAVLRPHDRAIVLEQLHFADEIRPLDEIRPGRRSRVDKRELKMAQEMIDSLRSSFEPEAYRDTYREALLAVIKAKRSGKVVEPPQEKPREEPTDLLDALRASVEAAKKQRGSSGGRKKAASTSRRAGGSRRPQRKRTRA